MTVKAYRNTPRSDVYHRSFGVASLPVKQTLVWCGPLFLLIQR
jgi:hypothetical protein